MPPFKRGSRLPSYSALRLWLRYGTIQSLVHFWRTLVKPVMLTEAIVETFNERKVAVMMHDMKIIIVVGSEVLSKNYYYIPSML
jgi:hypothetical protein